jgi:hypothetical protein
MGLQGRPSDGESKYVQSLVDRFDHDGSEAKKGRALTFGDLP